MSLSLTRNVTEMLLDWRSGNKEALGELMPLVYDDECATQRDLRLAKAWLKHEQRKSV